MIDSEGEWTPKQVHLEYFNPQVDHNVLLLNGHSNISINLCSILNFCASGWGSH